MKAIANLHAVTTIAGLTTTRLLRSKILLIAAGFAFLPLLPFLLGAGRDDLPEARWRDFMAITASIQLLVTALLAAPAIAEEIEDKTYAYLWSRPISRWTVLAGKLLTASAIGIAIFIASAFAGYAVSGTSDLAMVGRGIAALSLGVVAAGCMAAAFGTLMPKHPLAFSISYFLVLDLGIGAMPFAGARISVMHNVMTVAGLGNDEQSVLSGILWLVGLAVAWTTIGLWRLTRNEMSTGS